MSAGERRSASSPFNTASPLSHARVTISCPERSDQASRLVLLPGSLQELLDIGAKKFGFHAAKVFTTDGALVEDMEVIRDGDRLILAGDGFERSSSSS